MSAALFATIVATHAGAAGHAAEVVARHAYFGDLHVHTLYSFDAFVFGVRADPDDAYRYARGEPLAHPEAGSIRLSGPPLDFMAVTDHAEYLGVIPRLAEPDNAFGRPDLTRRLNSTDLSEVLRGHAQITRAIVTGEADPNLDDRQITASTWQRIIDAAERHYQPGIFTTFVGFEFTPHPGANLHRNVIFRTDDVPAQPFGALDSMNPQNLWSWLDGLRSRGIEGMAIPHNANWSNGAMFPGFQQIGSPVDADYAAQRRRNEPLVELTQTKGTSETHPLLSPNDEWAAFELFGDQPGHITGLAEDEIQLDGSYARQALMSGMQMAETYGFNPYRFGFIGSSDTHNAGAAYDERDYVGKLGIRDGTPRKRQSVLPAGAESWQDPALQEGSDGGPSYLVDWSAAGLAGVWAKENTREALYDAMRRRETFATSGPRIRIRMFAGYGIGGGIFDNPAGLDALYESATPMGGEMQSAPAHQAPELIIHALRDPRGAGLERLQVIKAWVEDGETHDRIFDVACADGQAPDPATHRCPAPESSVNLADCSISDQRGAVELQARWRDPGFDAGQRAFYYARVLENPTCRWSTWDAIRAATPPNPGVPATLQERAWTSPIWVLPAVSGTGR
ncbi:MAG: DUF3604 domain-containing protein [Gammaproteobacteria bacterium]|nr:DUF3604 domain-containing protein [Gammaproteobacteria bacterium]